MRQPILSPEKLAAEFNAVVRAYRKIDAEDVRDLTECGLIGRYGYYGRLDLEIIRGLLQYEQLRLKRRRRNEIRDADGAIHCRRCGALLTKSDNKRGRPKEYCQECEQHRNRDRYLDWKTRCETCRM